ncbi:MAG: host attachment protein, partial [Gluconacetobacter diazotrophicus]|nr:host attachment protein [Gluconacetobacter diazotrophicus]
MTVEVPNGALVLVADGRQAVLLRNTGAAAAIALAAERRLSPEEFAGQGPSGSRPDGQTVQQTAEATFAREVAREVERLHGQGGFEALVIVADPRTLGELREALHANVSRTVTGTLAKDLAGRPIPEIVA